MSRPIGLFSGYNQSENRTTNYCLLVLKLLYEENPKYLGEALGHLIDDPSISDRIGVQFFQQIQLSTSTPDGLIKQQAFTIYIETKHFDWFYDKQIENHLTELDKDDPGFKVLIALGTNDEQSDDRFDRINKICAEKFSNRLVFVACSFRRLLEAFEEVRELPRNLADVIREFRSYLDEQIGSQSWKDALDVVNCARSKPKVMQLQIYRCPAEGGNYQHRRCRFFGVYKSKNVEFVSDIEALIHMKATNQGQVVWNNTSKPKTELLERAYAAFESWGDAELPGQVFLLGPLEATDFRKDTPGGMMQHKLYFDVQKLKVKNAKELAASLNGKKWSDLKGS